MSFKALAIQYRDDGTKETRFASHEYETRHEAQMYADIIAVTWVDQSVHMEVVEVGGDENPEGIVVYTNAPPAYDYSYVEVVNAEFARYAGRHGGTHPTFRKLRIHAPTDRERTYRYDYQCGRYASGLYTSLSQADFDRSVELGMIEVNVAVPPPSPTGAVCPDCHCPSSLEDVGTVCSQCHRGVVIGSGLEDHNV